MPSEISHPNIAKITRQIDHIEVMYYAREFYEAWYLTILLLEGLKPADKKKHGWIKIMRELNYAMRRVKTERFLNAPDAQIKRAMLAARLDMNFHSRLMSILWDCKMSTAGAYEYYDPTGGKSSDKVVVEIGERDTTNIR